MGRSNSKRKSTNPFLASSPTRLSVKAVQKPWLYFKDGECQFKCCHQCRPALLDRSYLSLDGIANGDIPSTAMTGFGFHLQGERPVALVKHVANLGLRPSPPRVSLPLYIRWHQLIRHRHHSLHPHQPPRIFLLIRGVHPLLVVVIPLSRMHQQSNPRARVHQPRQYILVTNPRMCSDATAVTLIALRCNKPSEV